jgi:hypothetical protein
VLMVREIPTPATLPKCAAASSVPVVPCAAFVMTKTLVIVTLGRHIRQDNQTKINITPILMFIANMSVISSFTDPFSAPLPCLGRGPRDAGTGPDRRWFGPVKTASGRLFATALFILALPGCGPGPDGSAIDPFWGGLLPLGLIVFAAGLAAIAAALGPPVVPADHPADCRCRSGDGEGVDRG